MIYMLPCIASNRINVRRVTEPGGPHHNMDILIPAIILLAITTCLVIYARHRNTLLSDRHEDEWRYSRILDNIDACVYTKDDQGRYTYVNKTLANLFGATPEEIRGKTDADFFSPESAARTRNNDERVFSEGKTLRLSEIDQVMHSGKSYTFLTTKIPRLAQNGSGKTLIGISTDITDQIQTQKDLKQSERRYRQLFERMQEGFALHEILCNEKDEPIDYRFLAVNPAFETIVGLRAEQVIGKTVREVFPEIEIAWIETFGRVALTGEPATCDQYAAELNRHFRINAFSPEKGKCACIFEDITARKRATTQIARLAAAINQAAEGVVITDAEGAIEYVNPAFETFTGYTQQEVIGKNPQILKSQKTKPAIYAELWQTIKDGNTWKGRLINKRKDGTLYTQDTTISPVRDDDGRTSHYVAVTRDVTEELHVQEQLSHAQKMESVGRLAGGVAHDFNNLLMGIIGYTEMARDKLPENHAAQEELTTILASIKRTTDVTKQLLLFARKQPAAPQPLDPNKAIGKLIKMLGRLIGESIDLKWQPSADTWLIKMDPGQIDQMLANLCINARDAIKDAGTITIATSNETVTEQDCVSNVDATPGAYVCIQVQDSGSGMAPDVLDKIFDPFFTTKDTGKGTGLGLSTVYGIVTQADGWVDVASEPGDGTTFRLYLPRYAGTLTSSDAPDDSHPPPLASNPPETILVVEDEKSVRDVTIRFLQQLQYKVLSAASPQQALERMQRHDGEIDLLLTDIVMPDMNGVALAKKMTGTLPDLRVLFMSGYTEDYISEHGITAFGELLPKPFSRTGIAKAVRHALDTPQPTNR